MQRVKELLEAVASGRISPEVAHGQLQSFSYLDLGHTKLDLLRSSRSGFAEIIYAAGKDIESLKEIIAAAIACEGKVLATRLTDPQLRDLPRFFPEVDFFPGAKIAVKFPEVEAVGLGQVAIVTAGTSDWAQAEETEITCRYLGIEVTRICDVGVAGIDRLFDVLPKLRQVDVVIVLAGMEGALPTVVAGLVEAPVIAVPTSVGYGATFEGVTALLGMLVACSPGVTVVNIDNGFGAALAAAKILRHIKRVAK